MIIDPVNASSSPEVQMNEGFETLEFGAVYGKRPSTTTGLTWGYYGGRWAGFSVSNGTFTLADNDDTYIVVDRSDGAISQSTSDTNWNDSAGYSRVYKITTLSGQVTVVEDHRAGPGGIHAGPAASAGDDGIGYLGIPQNSQSAAYTTVLGDAGKHILHPASDNNPRTFTIDSNANVAYPIGTAITFVNRINTVTIAIASDTLRWAEDGTTGSRGLAANGIATALKIDTTEWLISGTGLS